MPDFFRALAYVFPYKRPLAACVVLVLLMGLIYSASVGAMIPMLKVFIGKEGLHGWVRRIRADDRLSAELRAQTDEAALGIRVLHIKPESPLVAAGVESDGGTVYLARVGEHSTTEGPEAMEAAVRLLVEHPADAPLPLTVRRGDRTWTTTVHLPPERTLMRLGGSLAGVLPEGGPEERYRALVMVCFGIVSLAALLTVLRFVQEFLSGMIAARAVLDIRGEAFDAMVRQSLGLLGREGVHTAMGRFGREYDEVREGVSHVLGNTLREPIKALAAVGVAFYLNWWLTLISMVLIPPTVFLVRFFGMRMRKSARKALVAGGALTALVQEVLLAMRVVKAYTMEGRVRRRFLRESRRYYKFLRRFAKYKAASGPVIEFMTQAAGAAVAVGGAYLVFRRGMAIEDFFAYLFCLAAIFDPLRKATTAMGRLRRAEAAARRIFDVIDAPSEADEATASLPGAETRDCPALTGDLEFQDVSFAYREDAPEVLRGVRLTIRAGETVAFVGPNGSGKTTLVSMVPRLYLPTRGQILWNGTDLREFSVRRLRRQIGLVTQDAIIFKGTVHDNIALDDPEIPREAVVRAARKARADEFIAELRDAEGNTGYDAVLAEHGHSLSGGQRQRIALARAILRDPSVLILDEATSQIDSRAEALIQEALAAFTQGRTTLVIAHRLSTVQHADRIVVMDGGAVAAVGTHAELAGSCGLYRDMCEQQFLTPAPKPDAPAAVGAAGTGA